MRDLVDQVVKKKASLQASQPSILPSGNATPVAVEDLASLRNCGALYDAVKPHVLPTDRDFPTPHAWRAAVQRCAAFFRDRERRAKAARLVERREAKRRARLAAQALAVEQKKRRAEERRKYAALNGALLRRRVADVNETVAQVCCGQKALVVHEQRDAHGVVRDVFMRAPQFLAYHDGKPLDLYQQYVEDASGDDGPSAWSKRERSGLLKAWLRHAERRRASVTFDPDLAPRNAAGSAPCVWNTWQGFQIRPRPGDWSRFRRFIFDDLSRRRYDVYEYLLNWLAAMYQRPGEPGQAFLVFRGWPGTGRGTFYDYTAAPFGTRVHALHLTQRTQLTGEFNEHLAGKVFVFADEAFFSGDHQAHAALKPLTTDKELPIRGLYQPLRTEKNCIHLMMSTNEVHAVRVDSNARRAVVVDNSNAHAADRAYFARIHEELAAGGAQAMLWDLLQRDVTHFNPQAPPRALDPDALAQKKLSFAPEQRWLFECIRDGRVAGVPLPKADDVRACRTWPSAEAALGGEHWAPNAAAAAAAVAFRDAYVTPHGLWVSTEALYEAYRTSPGARLAHSNKHNFVAKLRRMLPTEDRNASVLVEKREPRGPRRRGYVFPTVSRSRDAFARAMKMVGQQAVLWGDETAVPAADGDDTATYEARDAEVEYTSERGPWPPRCRSSVRVIQKWWRTKVKGGDGRYRRAFLRRWHQRDRRRAFVKQLLALAGQKMSRDDFHRWLSGDEERVV